MKKRGFGKGLWNGVGGKFSCKEGDRTIADTARRENLQEINIETEKLEKVAIIDFFFPKQNRFRGWNQQAHVYLIRKWSGKPKETDEVEPRLFKFKEVPYQQMWDDDIIWLPVVLAGKKIRATCRFDKNKETKEFQMRIVSKLEWIANDPPAGSFLFGASQSPLMDIPKSLSG